jgi:hypothetical protein
MNFQNMVLKISKNKSVQNFCLQEKHNSWCRPFNLNFSMSQAETFHGSLYVCQARQKRNTGLATSKSGLPGSFCACCKNERQQVKPGPTSTLQKPQIPLYGSQACPLFSFFL